MLVPLAVEDEVDETVRVADDENEADDDDEGVWVSEDDDDDELDGDAVEELDKELLDVIVRVSVAVAEAVPDVDAELD